MSRPIAPTRTLSSGSGGREHALAWKLASEPGGNEVIVAPGSDAIAREPRVRCVPAWTRSIRRPSSAAARREAVELVVIGPEAPLAAGVTDALRAAGIARLRPLGGGGPDRIEQGVLPRDRGGGRGPRWPGPSAFRDPRRPGALRR